MRVCKRFVFDAAHYLPGYDGKCSQLHGHSWTLEVEVDGPIGPDGMVMDFGDLKRTVNEHVIDRLDHRLLNDTISIPTAENLLVWMASKLRYSSELAHSPSLARLRLYETPDSFVELKFLGTQGEIL